MRRKLLLQIFMLALILRISVALTLNLSGILFSGLSRDSVNYHITGLEFANLISSGASIDVKSWVDDAWFLIIGYVYYMLPAKPIIVQLLNSVLGALAAVMTALMVWRTYGNAKAAFFAGWLLAVFPSFIYFNSLLLKDAASLFLMATLGWAVVSLRIQYKFRYAFVIILCLLGFLGVREYFFFLGGALVVIALLPIFGRSAVSTKGLLLFATLFLLLVGFLSGGSFDLTFSRTHYFDIDYINETRTRLNRGTGAIGGGNWGSNLIDNIESVLLGVYYFMFSVDPLDIDSDRQLFALPETAILLLATPPLFRGFIESWRLYRPTAIVLIIFGISVLFIYVSATTNSGALFRWRMQAFPFLFGVLAIGLTLKGSRSNPLNLLMNIVTRRVDSLPSLSLRGQIHNAR